LSFDGATGERVLVLPFAGAGSNEEIAEKTGDEEAQRRRSTEKKPR
jgi:hypothetical protein